MHADARHTDQAEKLKAEICEWSDLAYEMWALLCSSATDGHSTEAEWAAARNRLRDRFHAALPSAMKHRETAA